MPEHRIKNLIEFEKRSDAASNMIRSSEYYKDMENHLRVLCFPKNTNWERTGTYFVATHAALNL